MQTPKNNKATDKGCCEMCKCDPDCQHSEQPHCAISSCECHTPSLSEGEKLENKMVKFFWSDCLDPNDGRLLLDEIDSTENFDVIPKNSKGYIKEISVGMLRDIVKETISQTRQEERERMVAIGREMKKPVIPNMLLDDEVFESQGIDGVKGYNKAIETYQQKIKSLN